ncbi:MAG: ABC transporter permease [Bacteroidetes bacterium]|nr:ABC transporter permease [Bacteroidota bacterium]
MFKKNLAIAFRTLKKDWSYTMINIVGLTAGITCCLLILSFVKYEMSFDQFHTKKDLIYRVNYDVVMGGNQIISPSVPVFVAPYLKNKFPEIEDATRFMSAYGSRTIRHGGAMFDENGFCYADSNFFKILDFKPVAGDLNTALNKPNTLVITKNIATKYFGKTNPIGQTLLYNNKKEFVVTAVIENVPSNSHFSFDFLTSFYSNPGFDSSEMQEAWNNPDYTTFLLLKPGANADALSKKIDALVNPPGETNQAASQNSLHLKLEPLKNVHFDTQVFNFNNEIVVTDYKYIRIFITVAILVLLIACANYINLSTAKSSVRAKEVGIRKTIGASFFQVFTQFIAESFLMTFISVIISIIAVHTLLPYLNNLLGKQIPFYIFDTSFFLFLIGGTILVSLLAGFYPAMVLSRFRPVETLKGVFSNTGGITVRKSLVIFQFTISVALMLGTIIVRSQLQFMQSTKLGLDKDQIVLIHGNADIDKKLHSFAQDLRNINGVQDVSLTWRSPFETVIGNGFSIKAHPTSSDDWQSVGGIAADQHYLSTLGISLIAGRNFDPSRINGDSTINEFIVNQSFLRHYNLKPSDAIGKQVILGIAGTGSIIGVVKDFHTSSMHVAIQPVVLFNSPKWYNGILLRIAPGKLSPVISNIEKKWKASVPMRPFSYTFLDEEYDALYRTEQRLGTLMSVFCGIAILITCLGLFGLTAFMVTRRTKEIGIRKVLGASVLSITAMLSKDFVKLVIIAIVIAIPVAWYFMHKWIQDFAYRINIDWWVFLIAGLIALLIALITVSFHAIKAAIANPVKSLRTE